MVGSSHFTLDTPSVSNHALKKVKLWDKVRALEVLARHFGVLKDQMEQRGVIELRRGERTACPLSPLGKQLPSALRGAVEGVRSSHTIQDTERLREVPEEIRHE